MGSDCRLCVCTERQFRVPSLLISLVGVLESTPNGDSFILLGDFNAHMGNDSVTWRGVIGRNGLSDLKRCSVVGLLC